MGNGHGVIRVPNNQRCPKCNSFFRRVILKNAFNIAYRCPDCLTIPTRYYLDIHYKGERIRIFSDRQGMPLDTLERAIDLLTHINYEIDNHSFDQSRYVRSEQKEFYVMNLCERFLNFKIDSIAPSYQKDYKRMVGIIKGYYTTTDVRDLRKIHVINFKEYLEREFKLSGKSVKNIMDLFKTFLNYCKNDIELITFVPIFPDVEVAPVNFKWLSQEDQMTIFSLVPNEDKPIFAFLMLHGCRPSEARALKVKNVDLRTERITISATFSSRTYRERRKGKKSQPFNTPIHTELQPYITDRVRNNLPEAFLFVNPRTGSYYSLDTLDRIWGKIREKANLDKSLRLYDATRHSFASNLTNSGVSIYKVSRLLGHSSIKMTERYAHSEVENLRADIQRLSLNCQQTVIRGAIANEN